MQGAQVQSLVRALDPTGLTLINLILNLKNLHAETKIQDNQINDFLKSKNVEREVGGGIGMGNTCNSMADSCQCMTKPTTIL